MKIILEDNIGGFLYDLGVGKDFLNNTHTKGITIKDIKIKNFCLSKCTIHENEKTSHKEGEDLCKTYI